MAVDGSFALDQYSMGSDLRGVLCEYASRRPKVTMTVPCHQHPSLPPPFGQSVPTRPNGSTGWIKLSRVSLTGHNFHMAIDLGEHRLTAWKGGRVFLRPSAAAKFLRVENK